jgi:predicted MFS family arabinose efflux permease
MLLASGVANFDRVMVGPMLVSMAAAFDISVTDAAIVATAYLASYGITQPLWVTFSDRHGRVRVMQFMLMLLVGASLISAIMPTVTALVITRVIAGAAAGCVVSNCITYIGDEFPVRMRQNALSDLSASMAVGSAFGVAVAGIIAQFVGWRWPFVVVSIGAAVALMRMLRAYDAHEHTPIDIHPFAQFVTVLRSPWTVLVLLLCFVEGVLLPGLYAIIPAMLEDRGVSTSAAGLIAGLFGVSVVVTSRVVKRHTARPLVPLAAGALGLVVALFLAWMFGGTWPLLTATILFGVGWAAMHTSFQAWMTATQTSARAMAIAVMTATLFLGSGVGNALGAASIDNGSQTELFGMCTIAAILLAITGIAGRARFHA